MTLLRMNSVERKEVRTTRLTIRSTPTSIITAYLGLLSLSEMSLTLISMTANQYAM